MLLEKEDIEITNKDKLIYYYTVLQNPYIPHKPYPKQAMGLILASKEEQEVDGVKKPNAVLLGAGGFGGKTFLGSMLAVQFLGEPYPYTCLVTRRNYAELLDTDSIWENLLDWCCNEDLPVEHRCTAVKTPSPKIVHPNGNTIYFKAFDRVEKKQKFKSASYDRIINDEASELPLGILQFQYRSMRNTIHLPRSIINLSNPGGDSTEYLVEHFVDGDSPYIALDWRDNPYIDKKAYEGSLNELDYIDQQYQKYGNWHYRASAGDLVDMDTCIKAYIDVEDWQSREAMFCSQGMDLASTGRDNTVNYNLICLDNGIVVVNDIMRNPTSSPEAEVEAFVEKNAKDYALYVLGIELEPGSDSTYSLRYWRDTILKDVMYDYGVTVKGIRPSKSKFERARPVARAIRNGKLRFSRHLKDVLEQPNGLFDQLMTISPNPEQMKKQKSPDDVDALGYAWQEMSMYVNQF